jgi:2-oxoisovalerate dehydrogenase E1 component
MRKVDDSVYDWTRVASLLLLSRELDELEEKVLAPQRRIFYQFSARGHDLAQILLGLKLTEAHDAACGYYRSRPLLLALGVDPEDVLGAAMARTGGYSDGRDIGVVFNHPNPGGPTALPMCGGVGAQFTPAVGWAQAIEYRRNVLGDQAFDKSIAVALGGDASVATGGFWSALTIATTQPLPLLFFIEDNGYGLSVPSSYQTPGGNIASNLGSFRGLRVLSGDGTDPSLCSSLIHDAVEYVREHRRPCLLRMDVPRLQGHSLQDTQAYKSAAVMEQEWQRDPLHRLFDGLVPHVLSPAHWVDLQERSKALVQDASEAAQARPVSDPGRVATHVYFEGAFQHRGGVWAEGWMPPKTSEQPRVTGERINMVTATRRTLDHELSLNDRMLVFGEDVGVKGGVHAITLGLQEKYGRARVFDTSLSEEGIVGRAVGMALAGLLPVPEIQFRKYAEPATEQINDCGSMRWRTNNRFAAPMVLRIPAGFGRCGDPWHSQTNEVPFIHSPGWKVATPSNAEDAVGLLRTALRGNDPVVFFEYRALLDASSARRPYPGDDYALPFGKARKVRSGMRLTIVTWGSMVERCEEAIESRSVELIDLRTLMPWDREAVLASVRRTHRCLIVHEDTQTAGFGAEIAAVVSAEAFRDLAAPVSRLAMLDISCPYEPTLMAHALPSVASIRARIDQLVGF